ncbi:AAA family ATPase [Aquimarina longa]|uniref:AAA family ATPase n=1 Tax=Aquimarina longa TaxID=1080221 RepID=UPI0007858F3B|nr:AAA family ATPase [Aquimarina longa]
MHKRFIITGAPGTGKTTAINTLRKSGYQCFEEISRKIISHQQENGGTKTPWGDLTGFTDMIYQQTIIELQLTITKHTFVDRGLPDIIAYLQAGTHPIPEYLLDFPFKKFYNTTVFLMPLWEEIYSTDPQRPQSYEEAMLIHQHLIRVYKRLGFKVIVVPKTTVAQRVDFMQSIITTD